MTQENAAALLFWLGTAVGMIAGAALAACAARRASRDATDGRARGAAGRPTGGPPGASTDCVGQMEPDAVLRVHAGASGVAIPDGGVRTPFGYAETASGEGIVLVRAGARAGSPFWLVDTRCESVAAAREHARVLAGRWALRAYGPAAGRGA